MSVQNLSAIQANTDFVIENLGQETKEAAKKVETLFQQKFFNGGASSADAIQQEILTLQAYLAEKEEELVANYALLKKVNSELNMYNDKLKQEIYDVTKDAEVAERVQKKWIEKAIDEVNESYQKGEIEKGDMSSELSKKISQYCCIDQSIVNRSLKLNDTKSKINVLTARIASIIDQGNNLEYESKMAAGTLKLMQNLMSKMKLGTSNSATAANQRPIYTPTKQALVDRLAEGIKGIGGGGDRNSMSNPQMVKMKDFLGLNNNAIDERTGVPADSMLLEMKKAGFTTKEAMYAISWIFDGSNMSYTLGTGWSIPYGHGADAHNTYASLITQMNTLWGANAVQLDDDTTTQGGGTTPGDVTPVVDVNDENPEDPVVDENPGDTAVVRRTDPIGYADGDVTYEFVIDRDKDGKYDGSSEFLGAQNGMNELRLLDTNNDGVVSADELKRDDLFVLMTNHKTGEHGFMSASDKVKSIDLSTIQSKNWTNINNNKLASVFAINTVAGGTVQGYQTLDDQFYLNHSYNGVQDANMSVEVDAATLQEAQNIFNSIKFSSADEYQENANVAANDTKNAQNKVNRKASEMEDNYNSADGSLNKGYRPETAKERNERISNEIKQLDSKIDNLEKKIEDQKSKESDESKVQKRTKEQIEAEELKSHRATLRAMLS